MAIDDTRSIVQANFLLKVYIPQWDHSEFYPIFSRWIQERRRIFTRRQRPKGTVVFCDAGERTAGHSEVLRAGKNTTTAPD
jgi:hypothetical protein